MYTKDYYSPTFTEEEVERVVECANSLNDPTLANMIASVVVEDMEEDLSDPGHAIEETKIYYRKYYDIFSGYAGIDKNLLSRLEASTTEQPKGVYCVGERLDFYNVLSYGAFRNGIMFAVMNQNQEMANKLAEIVIADAEVDIPDYPEKAKQHYRRYYDVIKSMSIVSDELKSKLYNLLK